jgi:integrase
MPAIQRRLHLKPRGLPPKAYVHNCAAAKTRTSNLNKRRPLNAPAWKRMSNRTGNTTALQLKGGKWVPHDLRRTAATFMQSLGVAGEVIERCLNHTEDNKVKRIYQRDELIPQRTEAFKRLGDHLALLTRIDAENIVTLSSRKKRA